MNLSPQSLGNEPPHHSVYLPTPISPGLAIGELNASRLDCDDGVYAQFAGEYSRLVSLTEPMTEPISFTGAFLLIESLELLKTAR